MSESTEQAALFEWAARMEGRAPELALLFHIPNGGHRHPAVAAKMKAEGVKAGVWDCFLPVARGNLHGCWIEMKFGKNRLTNAQSEWFEAMIRGGYACFLCYDWTEAAQALCNYLDYNAAEFGL